MSTPSVRQPRPFDWDYQEIVLIADLVVRNDWQDPSKAQEAELSELLRSLPIHPLEGRPATFRGPGSVSRKVGDLKTSRPGYGGAPTKGGAATLLVAREFHEDPARMHQLAGAEEQKSTQSVPLGSHAECAILTTSPRTGLGVRTTSRCITSFRSTSPAKGMSLSTNSFCSVPIVTG